MSNPSRFDATGLSSQAIGRMAGTAYHEMDGVTRQMFLRRTAGGLVGMSFLSTFLAACGGSSTSATGVSQAPPLNPAGTLRLAVAAPPSSVDPTLAATVAETAVTANVFDGLIGFNSDYSALEPRLATRWAVSSDAREWELTLRKGVIFHDGAQLDSTVVRKNFEYMMRPTSPVSFLIGTPVKIDDSDPDVIKLQYKEPFPDLAHNLTFGGAMISPKLLVGSADEIQKRLGTQVIGAGPFRYAGQGADGSVTLEAFDRYWGSKAHLASVKLVPIPEESARVPALQAGDVDLVTQVAPLAARSLASDARFHVASTPTWTTVILNLVCSEPPFNDVRVRQALAYALDRELLVEKVLLGQAETNDSMLPPGVSGYVQPATRYRHNPAKARQLLAQAGHSSPPTVRMSLSADDVLATTVGQAIVAQLNAGGFQASVDVLENSIANGDQSSAHPKYDIHYGEWGWVNGGPIHLALGTMASVAHYTNPEYTGLVAKMNSQADGPARNATIAKAVELWARDVPWLTLWVPKRADASTVSLHGYAPPKNVFTLLGEAYLAGAR